MPSAESTSHIAPLSSGKGWEVTTDTDGLLAIADRHITKGLGRMKDHIFKEGKGLRVLTSVCLLGARDTDGSDYRKGNNCSISPLESESLRSDTHTQMSLRRSSLKLSR